MKCIAEWRERKAEDKVHRKSQQVARAVDLARMRGETPDHLRVPIGRAPGIYNAEWYARRVGELTVERLGSIGINGVSYDHEATVAASSSALQPWYPCETAAITAFEDIQPLEPATEVAGRLTIVLATGRK